jgi:tRNA pseudouridine55 synthase
MERHEKMLNGIVLLNKPVGYTSHDMVNLLRRILRVRKIGHTGTLDPNASGLLICCVGRSTRLARFFSGLEKTYRAVARFGITTDTMDAEGKIVEKFEDVVVDRIALENECNEMKGRMEQVPPMFSAVKIKGVPLYKLARKGITIERKARSITIFDNRVISVENDRASLEIRCSQGTYIRVLVDELGKRMGTGAFLESLIRTDIGPFSLEEAFSIEEIERFGFDTVALSPVKAMSFFSGLVLTERNSIDFINGQTIEFAEEMLIRQSAYEYPEELKQERFSVQSEKGEFLGIGLKLTNSRVKPEVVLAETTRSM